jgi:hypothetical protein
MVIGYGGVFLHKQAQQDVPIAFGSRIKRGMRSAGTQAARWSSSSRILPLVGLPAARPGRKRQLLGVVDLPAKATLCSASLSPAPKSDPGAPIFSVAEPQRDWLWPYVPFELIFPSLNPECLKANCYILPMHAGKTPWELLHKFAHRY